MFDDGLYPARAESWLTDSLSHLERCLEEGVLKKGVYGLASVVLRSIECGPVGGPNCSVASYGYYMMRWSNGRRAAMMCVTGPDSMKWNIYEKGSSRGPIEVCRGDFADMARSIVRNVYDEVNRVQKHDMIRDLGWGRTLR